MTLLRTNGNGFELCIYKKRSSVEWWGSEFYGEMKFQVGDCGSMWTNSWKYCMDVEEGSVHVSGSD